MAPISFKLSTLKLSINAPGVVSNNYQMPILAVTGAIFSVDVSASLLNQLFLISKASYTANPNDVSKWELALRLFKLDSTKTAAATAAGFSASSAGFVRPFPTPDKFVYDNTKVITSAPNVSPITYAPPLPLSTSSAVTNWGTTKPTDVYLVSDSPYSGYSRTVGTDYLTYYIYELLGNAASVQLDNLIVGVPQYISSFESLIQTALDTILENSANAPPNPNALNPAPLFRKWDQDNSTQSAATYNYLFELVKQIEKNDYGRIANVANFTQANAAPVQYTVSGASIFDTNAANLPPYAATDAYEFLFQAGDSLQFQIDIATSNAPQQIASRSVLFQVNIIA